MISRDDIQHYADLVGRRFRPHSVILFGSYAYGRPTDDSDVDLMVVMPHSGSGARMATRIRLACPRDFPMDLLVRSPDELKHRVREGDAFLREVTTKGVVLYEGSDARVG